MIPKWSKCKFNVEEVEYCGYLLSKGGLRQDPGRVEMLSRLRYPRSRDELETFVGMAGWHREYVKNLSGIIWPLERLKVECKGKKFWFNEERLMSLLEKLRRM